MDRTLEEADLSSDEQHEEKILYHAFEFFKNQLRDDDTALDAITHIDLVTQELGPEECGTLLVPFLAEAQVGMPMQILDAFIDAWYTLSKISNAESYIREIFQGIKFYLSQEDPGLRGRGIDLVVKIVEDLKCSDASYNVVEVILVPMIKTFSESEWFPEAMSACVLIPIVYNDTSVEKQAQLRESFKQLWETNLLIVRREVARNLDKLIAIMHIEHSVSMFWLVLKNMSVDNQEHVRAHCVEACLAFAKRCSPEQNLSFSYPVILAAARDHSWRVRNAVAKHYNRIYETFGEEEMCKHLFEAHMSLLSDANDIVQVSAMTCFLTWCKGLSEETIKQYISFFQSQLPTTTVKFRQMICDVMASFAVSASFEKVKKLVRTTVKLLINDDSLDVRLSVIKHMEVLCERRDSDGGLGPKIFETIDLALRGTKWHHRLILAEKTIALYHQFCSSMFEHHFKRMLFKLLLDSVWKVRNTMLYNIEKICGERKAAWVTDTILTEVLKIYIDPRNSKYISADLLPISHSAKIILIQALVAVTKSLDVDTALAQVVPLLITATKDSVPNVRFVAVKAMCNLFHIYKDEDPEPFYRLRCVLLKLRQDTDIDVRYHTSMALAAYQDYFDTATGYNTS